MLEQLRTETRPIRLVLMSGEQVMPNVEAVALFANRIRLSSVHVACTDSERKSRAPALRLKALLESSEFFTPFPNIRGAEVCISHPALAPLPQSIRQWFDAERARFPGSVWVLNLTGALKSMNYGLLDLVGEPDIRPVYLELGSGWQGLSRRDGKTHAEPLPGLGRASELIDRIGLLALAQAQYSSKGEERGLVNLSDEPLPKVPDLAALTRQLCDSGFRWKESFKAQGLDAPHDNAGPYLERYITALLMEAGVANVALSVKSTSDTSRMSMEVDVLFQHGGRLHTIDCKLPDADETAAHEQIRAAIDAAERLGGSKARAILLRPNWAPDELRSALAERSNAVVIDRAGCARLVEELGGLLEIPTLPPVLLQVQALLKAYAMSGREVFTASGRPGGAGRSAGEGKVPLLDLLEGLRRQAEIRRVNHAIATMGSRWVLAIFRLPGDETAVVPDCVRSDSGRVNAKHFRPLVNDADLVLLEARQTPGVSPRTLFKELLAGCDTSTISLRAVRQWLGSSAQKAQASSGKSARTSGGKRQGAPARGIEAGRATLGDIAGLHPDSLRR